MTSNIALKLSAAAMLAGLALAASSTAEASMTTRLQKCQYANKQKVIDCCQQIVKHKKPAWMIENNSSCQTAAFCVTTKKPYGIRDIDFKPVKKCSVGMLIPGDGGGGGGGGGETPPERPLRPSRR